MFTTKHSMSLRHPIENEIALTPTLSHRNGRGSFRPQSTGDRSVRSLPRPLRGRAKGESSLSAQRLLSKEARRARKFLKKSYFELCALRVFVARDLIILSHYSIAA